MLLKMSDFAILVLVVVLLDEKKELKRVEVLIRLPMRKYSNFVF